jgi:hypothetical protein
MKFQRRHWLEDFAWRVERVTQKFRLSRCLFPLCISLLCDFIEGRFTSVVHKKPFICYRLVETSKLLVGLQLHLYKSCPVAWVLRISRLVVAPECWNRSLKHSLLFWVVFAWSGTSFSSILVSCPSDIRTFAFHFAIRSKVIHTRQKIEGRSTKFSYFIVTSLSLRFSFFI